MNDQPEHMQAECIVTALDRYLATLPWPAPVVVEQSNHVPYRVREHARQYLVLTLAAALRMSEPRKSELEKV